MRFRATIAIGTLMLALSTLVWTELDRSAAAQAAPVDVTLGEFVFEPAEITAAAGTITFNLNNVDGRRHNMVIDVAGTPIESETLAAGTTGHFEVTIDQPGEYAFWCNVGNHRERGMEGKLIVQAPY